MAGKPGRCGGARPNSGPKPKSERFRAAINRAEKRIADRLPEVVDALLDRAEGVQVEELDSEGEARTYKRAPDFKAASYLIDRILGKPTQVVDAEVAIHDDGADSAFDRKMGGLVAATAAGSVPGEADAGG